MADKPGSNNNYRTNATNSSFADFSQPPPVNYPIFPQEFWPQGNKYAAHGTGDGSYNIAAPTGFSNPLSNYGTLPSSVYGSEYIADHAVPSNAPLYPGVPYNVDSSYTRGNAAGGDYRRTGSKDGAYNNRGGEMIVQEDTIFVQGMNPSLTEVDIANHFGSIGVIKTDKRTMKPKIWLYKDKLTGASKGECTVTYDDINAAKSAIQWFHAKDFNGSIISVQIATHKSNWASKARGGRGGFGGRGRCGSKGGDGESRSYSSIQGMKGARNNDRGGGFRNERILRGFSGRRGDRNGRDRGTNSGRY